MNSGVWGRLPSSPEDEQREIEGQGDVEAGEAEPLADLEAAIVEAEKAEREGENDFAGNLYLFFALRKISTPERALQYSNDIHAFLKGHDCQDSWVPNRLRAYTSAALPEPEARHSLVRARWRWRAFRKAIHNLRVQYPFGDVMQGFLRTLTPLLQVLAPFTIIIRAYFKIDAFKAEWMKKCGGVDAFCQYMKKYRFNVVFNPHVADADRCHLGERGLFRMNKFFLFNPYHDDTLWPWLTKLMCMSFVFAVGVRVSTDLSNDYRRRQQATLVARHFHRDLEDHLPEKRFSCLGPYAAARAWIHVGGLVRMASAIFMLSAMALILWGSETPKEVVLDALGLVFIYNLDTVNSEFGLISERDWDSEWMGRLYSMVVEPKIVEEIANLREAVIDTYSSEPIVEEDEKCCALCGAGDATEAPYDDDTDEEKPHGPTVTRGAKVGAVGSSSPRRAALEAMNLQDVIFRNMAEERVLVKVSGHPVAVHRLLNCGRCLYVFFLLGMLVLFFIGAPPLFSPVRTDHVIGNHIVYKCLELPDGTVIHSK